MAYSEQSSSFLVMARFKAIARAFEHLASSRPLDKTYLVREAGSLD